MLVSRYCPHRIHCIHLHSHPGLLHTLLWKIQHSVFFHSSIHTWDAVVQSVDVIDTHRIRCTGSHVILPRPKSSPPKFPPPLPMKLPPPRSDNKKTHDYPKQHVIYYYLWQLEYFSKTFKLSIKMRIRKTVRYETCYLHLWLETACISCFGSAFLTSQLCELIVWYFCADAKGKTEMCFLSYWIKPV